MAFPIKGKRFISVALRLPSVSVAIILLFISGFGCDNKRQSEENASSNLILKPLSVALNTDSGYTINPHTGDSVKPLLDVRGNQIPTGIPQEVSIRLVNRGFKNKPLSVHASWQLLGRRSGLPIPVRQEPPEIPVDESVLRRFTLGKDTSTYIYINSRGDTIPTGVPVPAIDSTVLVRFRPPEEALPPSFANESRFRFKQIDTYHGLVSSRLNDVLEDKRGNLWIASFDGLSCYDGKSIQHFTVREGLAQSSVYFLLMDSKGNLWIDYGNGVVSCYDGQKFHHYTVNKRSGVVFMGNNSMLEDSKGNIWFRSLVLGASRFDGKHFTHFSQREGLKISGMRCMMEDSRGNIWFGTHGNGAVRYDGKSFTYFTRKDGLNHNVVSAIVEDRLGDLWFGTDSGICRYNGKNFRQYTVNEGLSDNYVGSIHLDDEGNLWIGTYGNGITKFDGRKFYWYLETDGLLSNFVNKVTPGSQKNIWAATDKGISLIDPTNFYEESIGPDSAMPKRTGINKWTEDASGNLYAGFYTGSILKISEDSTSQLDVQRLPKRSPVISVLMDSKGRLWFGSRSGLHSLNGGRLDQYTKTEGLPDDQVNCLMEDRLGNIWVGTSKGICVLTDSGFNHYVDTAGKPIEFMVDFIQDKKDHIWISTRYGLLKIDGNQITRYSEKEGLPRNWTRDILEDGSGNIWATVDSGVMRFNGKEFQLLGAKNGFFDKFPLGMSMDSMGGLWTCSASAIWRISMSTFDASPNTSDETVHHVNGKLLKFGHRDGMKSQYFNVFRDKRNRLSVLANDQDTKLSVLELDKFVPQPSAPSVSLSNLDINDKFVNFRDSLRPYRSEIQFGDIPAFSNCPDKLVVPYHLNRITFSYHAADQLTNHRILYSYKMDGLDQGWSKPSNSSRARYEFLPPGKYTFQVRAMGTSQEWGEPASYPFTVNPPWWRSPWAYAFYGLLVLFGARWVHRYQKERVIRNEQEKARKIELAQAKEIEKAYAELKTTQQELIQREKMASLGELTAGIAHEIQNPLNFVNNFSDINRELIVELQEELKKGDIQEASFIAENLKDNEDKITLHGRRADGIVKSMLQHSRASGGQKEPTDVNKLVDEYVRLAYHGYRARNKDFHVTLDLKPDPEAGQVKMVAQDIGRVLLNLLNNAFHAVDEKAKTMGEGYPSTVTVSTKRTPQGVDIRVEDNGSGIPDAIREKIFQPFFTTKPTGQGTGLGLSLSYDIVTKGHDGLLGMESMEGKGSTFCITLPQH